MRALELMGFMDPLKLHAKIMCVCVFFWSVVFIRFLGGPAPNTTRSRHSVPFLPLFLSLCIFPAFLSPAWLPVASPIIGDPSLLSSGSISFKSST